MKNKPLIFGIAAASLLGYHHACAQTWTGGGADGNWSTTGNWTVALGASSANVTFDSASSVSNYNMSTDFALTGMTISSGSHTFNGDGASSLGIRFGNGGGQAWTVNSSGTQTFNSLVNVGGGRVLNINAGTSVFNGNIVLRSSSSYANGTNTSASLTKNGGGTAIFAGNNTYAGASGTTTVTGGALIATKAAALPRYNASGGVVINGGTVAVRVGSTGWTTAEADSLMANSTKTSGSFGLDTTLGDLTQWTTFSTANLGNALNLAKLGPNTLTLDQSNFSGVTGRELLVFSGANSGTVVFSNAAALGGAGNTVRFSSAGSGVLDLRTNGSLNAYNIASGTGNGGTISASRSNTDAADVSYSLGVLDLSSVTMTVSKGSNVSGAAVVSFSELKMSGGNDNNPVTLAGDADIAIGSASITNNGMSKRLQLDGTSANNVISGVISDTNNGTVGTVTNPTKVNLIKSNSSTWALQSVNTYTGSTTIKGGTLKINSSTAIGSSPLITVGDAGSTDAVLDATSGGFSLGTAQTLGGIGKILATGRTVTASGTIAPGNSVGTIQIDGGTLALNADSKFNFELGTASDLISLLNLATLDLGSGVIGLDDFAFSDSGGFGQGTYILISGASSVAGSLDTNDLTGQVLGFDSTLGISNNNLVLTVIPEPRVALSATLGLVALLRRRRS